jgi:Pyruvate/2-oxoacid:ferredoxin oxidoreductase gamma subunit
VNTAILGAFAAWSGLVSLDAVCNAILEEVPLNADANVAAARAAAAAVRRGRQNSHGVEEVAHA